jgi:hypothetical protein
MPTITLIDENTEKRVTFDLTNESKVTFLEKVDKEFNNKRYPDIMIDGEEEVPFEFRHAGCTETVLADSYWIWRDLPDEDKQIILEFIELTSEDSVTLEEAKAYFNRVGCRHSELNLKDRRLLFRYIDATGHRNGTLQDAKNYFHVDCAWEL